MKTFEEILHEQEKTEQLLLSMLSKDSSQNTLLERIQNAHRYVSGNLCVIKKTDSDHEVYWKKIAYASGKLSWYALAIAQGQEVSREEIAGLLEVLNSEEPK